MNTKHTPGPWDIKTVKTSCGICHMIGPFKKSSGMESHACLYDDYPGTRGGSPELLANAAIIAAAPELLEALQRLVRLLEIEDARLANYGEVEAARAAIAKATGESKT